MEFWSRDLLFIPYRTRNKVHDKKERKKEKMMWKEVAKDEKLELGMWEISVRDLGPRTFESNLVRLPGRLRASKISIPEWLYMIGRKMHPLLQNIFNS